MNTEELYKNIGRKIKNERERQGFSQEELADKSGIPLSHLVCHEMGIKREMFAWELFAICKALQVDIVEFFE